MASWTDIHTLNNSVVFDETKLYLLENISDDNSKMICKLQKIIPMHNQTGAYIVAHSNIYQMDRDMIIGHTPTTVEIISCYNKNLKISELGFIKV